MIYSFEGNIRNILKRSPLISSLEFTNISNENIYIYIYSLSNEFGLTNKKDLYS